MGDEFRKLFNKKSPDRVKYLHGLRDAKVASLSARIGELVRKWWDNIGEGGVLFWESRILQELGIERISRYVRDEFKKRGISLGRAGSRRVGMDARRYYVVTRCV